MKFSSLLQSILKASGWSQEELARKLDVSFVTLNSWVNDRSEPRKKTAEQINILYYETVGSDTIDVAAAEAVSRKARSRHTTVRAIVGDQEILDKLTLHLTYNTNTIEGSTMTLADTEEVLFQHKILTNRTQVEQIETRNHQAALFWLLEQLQQPGYIISEQTARDLHLRLMNGIISDAGQYRRHAVRIMGTHVTVANYLKIPDLLPQLFADMDKTRKQTLPLLASTHASFEKIHPFSDGNGRVGRLLMLAQALQAGIVPPLIARDRKYAYYKYLELAQTKDEFVPLQGFIAESILSADELLFKYRQGSS